MFSPAGGDHCPVCDVHTESTFKIEGMDCHEEVAILEKRLRRLTGLEAVDADVINQRLRVKYDAAKLSASGIAEAVAQTGMRAWLEHEEPRAHAGAPIRRPGDRRPCELPELFRRWLEFRHGRAAAAAAEVRPASPERPAMPRPPSAGGVASGLH